MDSSAAAKSKAALLRDAHRLYRQPPAQPRRLSRLLLGHADYFDCRCSAMNQAKSYLSKYLSIKYFLFSVTIANHITYFPDDLHGSSAARAVGLHPTSALYARSLLWHIADCFMFPPTVTKLLG
jgi:hypothetical protein